MAGVVVCHGSASVRDRIVSAAHGVPALGPARGAASAEELVALARRSPPALVLLDAHLPGSGPIEAMRGLRMIGAHPVTIMLAVPGDEITLDRAIGLGARGYLSPDVDRTELAAVAAHSLSALHVPQQGRPDARQESPVRSGPTDPRSKPGAVELTRRELEVLAGMSNGRSNSQIGADLYLSEDTVKTHARRLFRKLGAADRAQAVAIGLRQGMIS